MTLQKIVEPVTEAIGLSPKEVADGAAEQAKTLMDIVDQQNLFVLVQGKKYLMVEAWVATPSGSESSESVTS